MGSRGQSSAAPIQQPGSFPCSYLTGHSSQLGIDVSLSDILTPSTLTSVLSNPALLQNLVYPNLPSDLPVPPSPDAVRRIVGSPPFQAAARQLDQALATGQLQGLVTGWGLPPSAGTSVAAFLSAVKEQAKRKREGGSSGNQNRMDTD